ncbi:MAG TPA: hypothetical protein VGT00_10240 [Methylomirabilota bacterium]|nr:hypothetical protein [Methylomirabilota bacterium]
MKAHKKVKLGKHPPRIDYRAFRLADYVTRKLPPPPLKADLTAKVDTWPMMGNDEYNDCAFAAAGHLIMEWTANTGRPVTPGEKSILAAYSAVTGFVKKKGGHGPGAVVLDVLNHWRQRGIAGHRIAAFLSLTLKDREEIREAVARFGGCYLGLNFTRERKDFPLVLSKANLWRVRPGKRGGPGKPNPNKGHVVAVVGYDPRALTCVSWEDTYQMTWKFWERYADEAFAIISPDWLRGKRLPVEFNLPAVLADLKKVKRLKRQRRAMSGTN